MLWKILFEKYTKSHCEIMSILLLYDNMSVVQLFTTKKEQKKTPIIILSDLDSMTACF